MAEVAARLGTITHSLYAWIKRYDPQQPKTLESSDPSTELAKLKKELQRVTERPRCTSQVSPNEVRLYSGQSEHMACPSFMFTLDVHHSGYYAWLKQPTSKTAKKRQQLLGLIKQF